MHPPRAVCLTSTCATLLFVTATTRLISQSLLKDINTMPTVNPSSDLHDLLTIGSRTFLGITTPTLSQLWISDGTTAGTTLVREMGGVGEVSAFCNVGGVLFFTAPDLRLGQELWRSDGTEAGTVIVKDIVAGAGGSHPYGLVEVNGVVVFANGGGSVAGSMWRSDGTGAGTYELMAAVTAITSRVGSVVPFVSADPINGEELWGTDGSLAGTHLLRDCRPGPASGSPAEFSRFGSSLVFRVDVGAATRETWITDGTSAGTRPLREVYPGLDGASPTSLTAFGTGYLCLKRSAAGTDELWFGDGSAQGTTLVMALGGVSYDQLIHSVGNRAVFEGSDASHGHEVWVTDGTSIGTQLVDVKPGGGGSNPTNFFKSGTRVFFTGDDSVIGRELYCSDGTAAGTRLVADINPNSASDPYGFFEVQGRVLFTANDGVHGFELWRTDGTPAGTALLLDIRASGNSDPDRPMALGGIMLFSAIDDTHGRELWRTDGTSAGTFMVADLNSGGVTAGSLPWRLVNFGGDLMFTALQPADGLWRSDGTTAGTLEVATGFAAGVDQIVVNGKLLSTNASGNLFVSDGTTAGTLVLVDAQNAPITRNAVLLGSLGNDVLLFNFVGDPANVGLWRSDGTAAGTVPLVVGVEPTDRQSSTANRRWAVLNGVGYFRARDRNTQFGFELWRTDGTTAGTQMVKDIYPGAASSTPGVLCVVNGWLVFHADHSSYGRELWRSDGTAAGTNLIVDLNPGPAIGVSGLWLESNLQGGAFMLFPGNDGARGLELYRTDGTTLGTTLVRDIVPGPGTAFANQTLTAGRWVVSGNLLYFPADDGQIGMELWSSDGTMAGTRLVRDIRPDGPSSFPSMLTPIDSTGRLLFAASGPDVGNELWTTDGTAVGTQLLADMTPGPRNTAFGESLRIGSNIYFTADDGTYGREVWSLSVVTMQGTIVERFGWGCGGPLGRVPDLGGIGLPRMGESGFALRIEDAAAQAPMILQLGASWRLYPIGNGCTWWPSQAVAYLAARTDAGGSATLGLPIPSNPRLTGLEIVGQVAVLDTSQSGTISITTSNAVYLLVGR